jgi:hypothetical protein
MITPTAKPAYVSALEAVFGPPSQSGFGSAVFYQRTESPGALAGAARDVYQHFIGDLWQRYGAEAWMGNWQQVYTRPPAADHAVVAELHTLDDRSVRQSAAVLLDAAEDPQAVQAALATACDDPAVTDLVVYKIGDGAALSGILLAARRAATGETIMLVFLLD